MVKEITLNEEETMLSKTEIYRQKALGQLSILEKEQSNSTNLNIEICNPFVSHRDLDHNYQHFYPSTKKNYFKERKMVLNKILSDLEKNQDFLSLHPSLVKFKQESIKILNTYIDSASLAYHEAIESAETRSKNISNQISKKINLFNNLQSDFEDLKTDLYSYLE